MNAQGLQALAILTAISVFACGGDEDDAPPPVNAAIGAPQQVAPTHTAGANPLVTVVANSSPQGAMVTGGGRELGITPLTAQVPIPPPQPGQVQSFAFTFTLDGHQPATINASPVNNTISITAALAPMTQAEEVGGGQNSGGDEIVIRGRGGGPIYDDHTTTGSAAVERGCTIDRLRVRLRGTHSYYRDLHITLRDPAGNRYSLARGGRRNPFRTHTVRRAAGREARGRWTISIADRLRQDSGILRGWQLRLRCR